MELAQTKQAIILREINFRESKSSKNVVLAILGAMV